MPNRSRLPITVWIAAITASLGALLTAFVGFGFLTGSPLIADEAERLGAAPGHIVGTKILLAILVALSGLIVTMILTMLFGKRKRSALAICEGIRVAFAFYLTYTFVVAVAFSELHKAIIVTLSIVGVTLCGIAYALTLGILSHLRNLEREERDRILIAKIMQTVSVTQRPERPSA